MIILYKQSFFSWQVVSSNLFAFKVGPKALVLIVYLHF